jgi:hypothetical protein
MTTHPRYRNNKRHTKLPRHYLASPRYSDERITDIRLYVLENKDRYPFGIFCYRGNYCDKCLEKRCRE